MADRGPTTPNSDAIQQGRARIDQLDARIVELLQERAQVAQQIGAAKDAASRGTYAPDRERQVLERVQSLAEAGPLGGGHVAAIYRQIISACRALERELKIGYFGPAATFTHQAAIERFGDSADFVAMDSIPEVFAETQRGRVDFGVVPVENSTEGAIQLTLDSFIEADVKVCSEIVLPISMQLMGRVKRDEIKTLYSFPVALAQCRGWVARNLPNVQNVDAPSNAGAAILAAKDPTGAAIGPRLAAAHYGLDIVDENIQDLAANFTRFYAIARSAVSGPTGRDKTAILFSIRDHVGALRDVADVFATRSINMSSIQSRPSRRRAWDYVFFVELSGHEQDAIIAQALGELQDHCAFLKVLGSWPVEEVATLSS